VKGGVYGVYGVYGAYGAYEIIVDCRGVWHDNGLAYATLLPWVHARENG